MEELQKLKKKTKKIGITVMILFIIIAVILIFFEQIYDLYNKGECYENYESQVLELFNSKFTAYIGDGVKYNIAKQCIYSIKANNEIDDNNHIIECKTDIGDLKIRKTYTIDCGYDNDGYINLITITEER